MYQTSLYWPSTRGLRGPFWRQFIWLIQATNVVFAEEGEQVNKLGNFGQTTFYWRLTFSFLSMGKVKIYMFWFLVKVFLGRNLWKTGVMALFMVSWYRQSSILMMIGDIDFWKGRTWCMWLYKRCHLVDTFATSSIKLFWSVLSDKLSWGLQHSALGSVVPFAMFRGSLTSQDFSHLSIYSYFLQGF